MKKNCVHPKEKTFTLIELLVVIAIIAILAAIALSEIVLLIATKERTPIHDLMAGTVTIDIASQMIFDSPEALLLYKQQRHAEMVNSEREQTPNSFNK